jgi:hypothetical protein
MLQNKILRKRSGRNLLGFALMEMRDELRRLYKNYDLINKKFLRD